MRIVRGACGAPCVFMRFVDALCIALILVCAAVSAAAAVFGVSTVIAGYPTFGGNGYCYVGDEGVPDSAEGRTLLVFRGCGGAEVRIGDTVIYDSGAGARAGLCVAVDGARQRAVLNVAEGITSVPFSSVVGVSFDGDERAGKFVGALADIYPASSIALFSFAAAVIAVAAISAAKRRRESRGGEISGRKGARHRSNAVADGGADGTEADDGHADCEERADGCADGEERNGEAVKK